MASVPNVEDLVEKTWLSRIRAADPTAELELQTAVHQKDPNFSVRSNPSVCLSVPLMLQDL